MTDFAALVNTHDLRLPDWGPYTKKYMGISHIPDVRRGFRFDLSVFPGFYRRKVDVPNVMWESGYHPWEAAPDLSYYCQRHELEWKDRVYCDISFVAVPGDARLVRCACVNNTDEPQNIVLHYMAYLNLPPIGPYTQTPLQMARVELPPGAIWQDALDYAELSFATPRPTDNLNTDGYWRGEIRAHGFVNGGGVGRGFGRDRGDTVSYCWHVPAPIGDAVLLIRYRMAVGETLAFSMAGLAGGEVTLSGSGELQVATVPVGDLAAGEHTLTLRAAGGAPVELDGLALVARRDAAAVRFRPVERHVQPAITPGELPNSIILKYPDLENSYGLIWDYDKYQVREFLTDELDRFMRHTVHQHVQTVLMGNGEGHFTNVFMRPIPLAPHETQVIYGLVCSGAPELVAQRLRQFAAVPEQRDAQYAAARQQAVRMPATPAGAPYVFSQERMAATVLANVVYPVYTRRTYIRHNTPGRWWDCLYTWDSGFVGLGLAELDIERAIDCLNAYVTEPGDTQAAFIHHGSPVPVQMSLYLELWNRTQSRELLAHFYPRLRQYHRFLCGKLGSSTTRTLQSNLIKTWDYFYNSGGWDDYPPQVHVHAHRLEGSVAPIANTSHAIRSAKILRQAAIELGEAADVAEDDADIALFTAAIQRHAWDDESGYFGYVQHDDAGQPTGILRHESGANYNMGLDGAYPLVAGICTPEQEARLIAHLATPGRLWSRIGLSTVDQSAPYFRVDGYWNGAVWMPHQWFFWKALLDLGHAALARRIAQTALDVWRAEVEASYHCFEHFIVASGRGAGWHQFSGLSSPVLNWFGSYHRPGRLTVGYDTWIVRQAFADDNRRLRATLRCAAPAGRAPVVIAAMNPAGTYRATCNGQPVAVEVAYPGTLEIRLPADTTAVELEISQTAEP